MESQHYKGLSKTMSFSFQVTKHTAKLGPIGSEYNHKQENK
jgi:hypothetical protein